MKAQSNARKPEVVELEDDDEVLIKAKKKGTGKNKRVKAEY